MAEYLPALTPDGVDRAARVVELLAPLAVRVEFRPHAPVVERLVTPGPRGSAVSTVDVAEVTSDQGRPVHVVMLEPATRYAAANLLGAYIQLRARLDHGRWLWATRAERTRSNGLVVTTLAVHDEDQAAEIGQRDGLLAARKPDCPGRAGVLVDFLTAGGGYLADCRHCRWQGPIRETRATARRDAADHNEPAAARAGHTDECVTRGWYPLCELDRSVGSAVPPCAVGQEHTGGGAR